MSQGVLTCLLVVYRLICYIYVKLYVNQDHRVCSRLHLTPSNPTSSVHPYHPQQVSSYPLINVLTVFKCFMGGIQVESCQLLYQSLVINKQHLNDWLLISRFTKQFPSKVFHKHFMCFKTPYYTVHFTLYVSFQTHLQLCFKQMFLYT